MCALSNVGDYWKEQVVPIKYPGWVDVAAGKLPEVSRWEFDQLRKDVLELKELLKAAKNFDEQVGESDCEAEDKVALIKAMAKVVGVDLEDLI